MAQYFIRYIGHLIQQPGIAMPTVIYFDMIRSFDHEGGEDGLQSFVNQQAMIFVAQQGMAVLKNINQVQDGTRVTYDHKMFVPMHMIAFIDCVVRRIEEPRPKAPELALLDGDAPDEETKGLVN